MSLRLNAIRTCAACDFASTTIPSPYVGHPDARFLVIGPPVPKANPLSEVEAAVQIAMKRAKTVSDYAVIHAANFALSPSAKRLGLIFGTDWVKSGNFMYVHSTMCQEPRQASITPLEAAKVCWREHVSIIISTWSDSSTPGKVLVFVGRPPVAKFAYTPSSNIEAVITFPPLQRLVGRDLEKAREQWAAIVSS